MPRNLDAKELGALITLIVKSHDCAEDDPNHDKKIGRLAEDVGVSRASLYNAMQGKLTELTKALMGFAYLLGGMPGRHEDRRRAVLTEFVQQFGYTLGERHAKTSDGG